LVDVRADLIAENLCLRQQLIVLHRRTPRQCLATPSGLGQRAPCELAPPSISNAASKIIGRPVLGGLHHVYEHAA
jgi:hypothetical protein